MLVDLEFDPKYLSEREQKYVKDIDLSDGGLAYVHEYAPEGKRKQRFPHTCAVRLQTGVYESFTLTSHLSDWTKWEEVQWFETTRVSMDFLNEVYDRKRSAGPQELEYHRSKLSADFGRMHYGIADTLEQILANSEAFLNDPDPFVLKVFTTRVDEKDKNGPYIGTEGDRYELVGINKLHFHWHRLRERNASGNLQGVGELVAG